MIIFSSAVVAFLPSPLAFFLSTFWHVINHAVEQCMSLLFVFNIDLSPRELQTTKSFLVQIFFCVTSEFLHREGRNTSILHELRGPHLGNHTDILNSNTGTEACAQ